MAMMKEAVIVDALRTPVGRRKGQLKEWHPVDLMAQVLRKIVERNGIDSACIDDVILGCASQFREQSRNIARNAALAANFPVTVPGTTIDRRCGSSQQAIHFAAQGIMSGNYEVVIAGGVESMTKVPLDAPMDGDMLSPYGSLLLAQYDRALVSQGLAAERIAQKWNLKREELDTFSLESHRRAAEATAKGHFAPHLLSIRVQNEDGTAMDMEKDEGIRTDTSMEKLAKLQPAFQSDGLITAGNSSQISDGAAAVVLMALETAQRLGLKPRARFVSFALAAADPTFMLTAPIPATQKVLDKAGMKLDQIDLVEISEAFASVVLAWQRETDADMSKVNVNGGAIAIGHPIGASGARLAVDLLGELERTGKRYGLQTMCEGGGMANAMILERLD
ncbi:MAG TPA: thiolase family protein [Ktedonosporobacter sp.]|nr:thiolase family protein [Ktedonosporobacter sp.]